METQSILAGAILASSWGYEQTNVDFYVVVKGGAVGKMIQIRKIQKSYQATGDMTGKVLPYVVDGLPQSEANTPLLTKKLQTAYDGHFMVKIQSYAWAKTWEGKAMDTSSYA